MTLSWSAVLDPNPPSQNGGYNWEIGSSSTFATIVQRNSTFPSVTQVSVGGLVAGTYFWRVQAVDGAVVVGPWSATRSFTVTGAGAGALPAPVLAPLPFGTAYHPMEHFPFSWSAVSGASSYVVEASRNASFPSPVDVRFDNIPVPNYSFTFHESLIGSWNLRVRRDRCRRGQGCGVQRPHVHHRLQRPDRAPADAGLPGGRRERDVALRPGLERRAQPAEFGLRRGDRDRFRVRQRRDAPAPG